jgi:arabinogalactan oligomer/maltooligosaccharide transport system permease protein
VEAFRWKGQQLGAPLAFKTLALFYNRKLVAKPPTTTDELLAMGAQLSSAADGRFALAYQSGDFYYHVPWLFGFGGSLFQSDASASGLRPSAGGAGLLQSDASASGLRPSAGGAGLLQAQGKLELATPPVEASLRFVADLQARGLIPQEATSALVSQLFSEGKAAMAINGPWFVGELPADLDYGVAPLPIVSATGQPARPFLTVEGLFVSAHAPDPAGAQAALAFLISDEAGLSRARRGKQLAANKSVYLDPQIAADPVMTAFRAQAERAVPMSSAPAMQLLWEPAQNALRGALRGEDPHLVLAEAQRQLEALQRPPPPPAKPWGTLALLALLGAAGFAWWRRQRKVPEGGSKAAYFFVLPAAVATLTLVIFPIVFSLALACFHHGPEGGYDFVGLGNFTDILSSRGYAITEPLSFYFTLAVTVLWTVVNLAFHVGLGMALALLLHAPWLRLRPLFRILLIVPWAVPNYITALIWKGLFHRQFGAVNALLAWVGLPRVSWFSHFSTAFAANVCTNVWLGFPFMMVVTLGALSAIPRELYDAAALDGAGPWQRFWHVTLPQLRPAILPAVVLGGVWTFNMFNVVWLVSGGEPGGSTDILISEAYRWAFARQAQYGYAAAFSAIIFVLLSAYAVGAQRLLTGKEARA